MSVGWRSLPLWPHQRDAVAMVAKYLDEAGGQSQTIGSALVRMPTGTGKSAVIAVITRCFDDVKHALVLAPSLALRQQLAKDIREDIWRDVFKIAADKWPKNVVELLPSTITKCLIAMQEGPTVLVATIKALNDLTQTKGYQVIKSALDLVVFDEGHREPAPQWALAVRALNVPTVLLTATPYRNDHKMFEVDGSQFAFGYTHQDAEKNAFLRSVTFIETALPSAPDAFVRVLLRHYARVLGKPSLDKRVIVRCETAGDVSLVARALAEQLNNPELVIGIHDTFDDQDERTSLVPQPDESSAIFWVHQYKLLEGIDSPSFRFLAMYRPLKNSRALVQQIGRILRNPLWKHGKTQKAYVLCDPGTRQRAFWDKYRDYETRLDQNPDLFESRFVMENILQLQPEWHYFERDFRERLDLDEKPIYPHLRYRFSANVYNVRPGFTMKELNRHLVAEWQDEDCEVLWNDEPPTERGGAFVLVYVKYQNSPLLTDRSLFEYRLGYTICRQVGRLLFFSDTEPNRSDRL